ncbi:MAG: hypothetical protein HQL51_14890 [Magnetococcales bacterium]|nr:hypothetical protein [Magnetococcales bacterium]
MNKTHASQRPPANLEERDRLHPLSALASRMRQQIALLVKPFPSPYSLKTWEEGPERRRARASQDFRYFARTYFPHCFPASQTPLLAHLLEQLPWVATARKDSRLAVSAPPGEGKTTLLTRIFPLWCILFRRRTFLLLTTSSPLLGQIRLEAVKAELEANPRLLTDFPEGTGTGPRWRLGDIITLSRARMKVVEPGACFQEDYYGKKRPDLLLLDDPDPSMGWMGRQEERKAFLQWLEAELFTPRPDNWRLDAVWTGAPGGADALLEEIMADPRWRAARFRESLRRPEGDFLGPWKTDPPGEIPGVLARLIGEEGVRLGLGVLFKEPEMRLSWSGQNPLNGARPELVAIPNAEDGENDGAATATEPRITLRRRPNHPPKVEFPPEQPAPSSESPPPRPAKRRKGTQLPPGEGLPDGTTSPHPPEHPRGPFHQFHYWEKEKRGWIPFGALEFTPMDPSHQEGVGSLLVGGFDPRTGQLNLLESDNGFFRVDRLLADAMAGQVRFGCRVWAIGSNLWEGEFRRLLEERMRWQRISFPCRMVSTTLEETEALSAKVNEGMIRFHQRQGDVMRRLRWWNRGGAVLPTGLALSMLWKTALDGINRSPARM